MADIYQDPKTGLTYINGKLYDIAIDSPDLGRVAADIDAGVSSTFTQVDGATGLSRTYTIAETGRQTFTQESAAQQIQNEAVDVAENAAYEASLNSSPPPISEASQQFRADANALNEFIAENPVPNPQPVQQQDTGFIAAVTETASDIGEGIADFFGFGDDEDPTPPVQAPPSTGDDPTAVDDGNVDLLDPNATVTSPLTTIDNFRDFGLDNSQLRPTPRNWDDWRVRLSLGRDSRHLYKTDSPEGPGILYPLVATNGIIFPYTPTINIQYNANYQNYEMTHSNYLGYFYKGSAVTNLNITATFTAQDTNEANYLLASLHFLRSCTKMFYGQDAERGTPPPLVFLTGLGEYNFNDHPCVVSVVNYNLPNDVDYIPAGVPETPNKEGRFQTGKETQSGYQSPLTRISPKLSRLLGAGLTRGALNGATPPPADAPTTSPEDLAQLGKIYEGKTYVPTRIDINFTLIPIQTREQVSNQFSLRKYANGNLIKNGGFW